MPMHDWARVGAGAYHDFHTCWLVAIRAALNGGLLPPGYYAMAEQTSRTMGPDVLTLAAGGPASGTGLAVADAPPRVRFTAATETRPPRYADRRLAVRHADGDRMVAVLELVSRSNKAGRDGFRAFVRKVVAAVEQGLHATVIDPFPPTRRDPHGLHAVVWDELGGPAFVPPADKPLTLAAYEAGPVRRCYVEPVAAGDVLPDIPLFLEPGVYVPLPLEATYQSVWPLVPPRYRAALEAAP